MHADEIVLFEDTVRELLTEQFPQWRNLEVRAVSGSGTSNSIFRIGSELAARFPRRRADPQVVLDGLEKERAATTEFARHCPFPVPRILALGRPGLGYPLPWTVQSWLPGTTAAEADPSRCTGFVEDLATLIASLRAIDTHGAQFAGTNRGGDLQSRDTWMKTCFQESEEILDVRLLRRLWSKFRELPRRNPDQMCHGDLIPGNVLVTSDRLVGILDAGEFGPADPALDLIAGWHLLDDRPRELLKELLNVDDLEWNRGMAWAFEQSMGAVWYYRRTNESMSRMGLRTLDRICAHADRRG
jgi:aminoglycoside phosphotransferase (APT) family kinase protein